MFSLCDSGKIELTTKERHRLEELLLVEKVYKVECPAVIYEGRKEEIRVIELPGGLCKEEYRLDSEENSIVETEGMFVWGKKAGATELAISIMENGLWKKIETIYIKVVNHTLITELLLFPKNTFLATGMEKKLELSYKPDNADNVSEILWKSSDTEIATVNMDGLVIGNAVGRCEITAYTKEATCTIQVEVQPGVEDIILPVSFLELTVGDKVEFKYSLKPEDCYEKELIKVFNSNPNVVDYNGRYITAKSRGTSTLSIYTPDESLKRSCVIEVKKRGIFG